MRILLAAALALAAAVPASAQQPAAPSAAPAARQPRVVGPRAPGAAEVAGTPGTPTARRVDTRSPDVEAAMLRAQKAAETRDKAWDARMKRTMGSICAGC